jgi:hypothetical protein
VNGIKISSINQTAHSIDYPTTNIMSQVCLHNIVLKHADEVYTSLETLCIYFPGRISGSETLEKSLDFLYDYASKHLPEQSCGQEAVLCVPCWVRGDWKYEYCEIEVLENLNIFPNSYLNKRNIRVLANGLSIGTGQNQVQGDIITICSWDELKSFGEQNLLHDKIVLYDFRNFSNYGENCGYRRDGANKASEYGAKAVLIRSLTPDSSISGVHTGI